MDTLSFRPIAIDAIAECLPDRIVTNDDLMAEHPDWQMDKLALKTGVYARPIAAPGETALDFGVRGAQKLVRETGIDPQEIDAVIFCTQTPDYVMPQNSSLLAARLGLRASIRAFDITHACAGFVYGLDLAAQMIAVGDCGKVLLVNSDTYSRLIDPADRSVRALFGDGAAATLVSRGDGAARYYPAAYGTDGSQAEKFIVRDGGMRDRASRECGKTAPGPLGEALIAMDGIGVLSFFTSRIPEAVREYLTRIDHSLEDVDHFMFHQASLLALNNVNRGLKIDEKKLLVDIGQTGNLVSASIPVTFGRAVAQGRVKRGDKVLFCGFGVGLSWATTLIEF